MILLFKLLGMHIKKLLVLLLFLLSTNAFTQRKFAQLDQILPDPNTYRTASGSPGKDYWQQQADYNINIKLDETNHIIYGEEVITYTNNSPDVLSYLWIQLDQNVRAKDSDTHALRTSSISDKQSTTSLENFEKTFDGGFKLEYVKDGQDNNLQFTIVKTMMRVDLPTSLKPNSKQILKIKWHYNINNTREIGGRSGYEHFDDDNNDVYCIAQFYPRMCVYNDIEGWQNKQFLGRGEFTVGFGDFKVSITVPDDYLVAASGELTNSKDVLTHLQQKRLQEAKSEFEQPIEIATLEEANERIKSKSKRSKTWNFEAKNVRDFAFAASRRFIWDALNTKLPNGKTAMAMSMWVKEGDCLWSKFSTKAVAHTLKWYSHYTIDYPYPVAWSIDGNMGMEYPMICFNHGRCEDDGTYDARMKYSHIGVIIHEVGHNFFPMIINSDERQWTWMDEGLNTFVQYLTEQQWERNYPSRRGPAQLITEYMAGDQSKIAPIMTNSESIIQFGNNAYFKPATALNILRETILGRELFDYAFKEYATKWAFKQPYPADFFRTMEEASGVDLDWFWRGWFYTTEPVDISLIETKHFKINPLNPEEKFEILTEEKSSEPINISTIRNNNEILKTYNEIDTTINDFYTTFDENKPNYLDKEKYQEEIKNFDNTDSTIIQENKNYYQLSFENLGGLPMPIILQFKYQDGTDTIYRIPAEIWRFDDTIVTKVFPTDKEVKEIILDPFLETADIDRSNNYYPRREEKSRFEIFKAKQEKTRNPMQIENDRKSNSRT